MGKIPYYFLVFLFVIVIVENEAKRQGDAIDKLYRAEYLKLSHLKKQQTDEPVNLNELLANRGLVVNLNNQIPEELEINKLEEESKEKDLIKRLPGQPLVKFSQYGGYITVDKIAGRAFYYYFVESETPQTTPLFLWLNGGPGCSSLGYGAMHEVGPFRVLSDAKTLYLNKYSWNNVANMLFVESPAKVGFSYSNRTSDYVTYGDGLTAKDNYMFIIKWLERFPEYKDKDFYIGGESYSGHYVPQLANLILQHNNMPNFTTLNLKGILIGNPALNLETDVAGMFDYFAGHGICSIENIQDVHRLCKFTAERNDSIPCLNAITKTYINTNDIDIYSIFAPTCKSFSQAQYSKDKIASVEVIDPCSTYYVYKYLNKPRVQAALHANTTKLLDYPWAPCSDDVIELWKDKPNSVLPLLQQFMSKRLKVWLFSGDQDAKIPFLATQYSIKTLNLTRKTEWYPWFSNGDVGGFTEEYNGNLRFATVRGAGHEVPYYQPRRAFTLFQAFISGSSPPPKHPEAPPST